jgi:hypothetical protein
VPEASVGVAALSVFALFRLTPLSLLILESVLSRLSRVAMLFVRERRPVLEFDRENVFFTFSQALGEDTSATRFPEESFDRLRSSNSGNSELMGERSPWNGDVTDRRVGITFDEAESSLTRITEVG